MDVGYAKIATAYDALGKSERAIQDFDESIRLDPNNALAYNNRGLAEFHLEDYEPAVRDFDQAIMLEPDYTLAHANRARAYTMLGRDADAQQDVDRSAELGFERVVLQAVIEDLKSKR